MSSILVVDDEAGIRELLSEILQDEGHEVKLAENAGQARAARSQAHVDAVLLDIWMPDTDGITLLREWASSGQLTVPVIMMSGHGTIDTAVEATRIGAFDFLEKPIALQKLLSTVSRALKRSENLFRPGGGLSGLGKGAAIEQLRKRLEQVSAAKSPLLLVGEPGSGFEICARFLHRPDTAWLVCEDTKALVERPMDLLAEARGGTLYLREIADLTRLEQKGLALLVSRLPKYNVRLIAATSHPLGEFRERGFDADLFAALTVVTVALPSLKDHRDDIPELAVALLAEYVERHEVPVRFLDTAALNLLRNEQWPGNLSQLGNVIKTAALTALSEEIGETDIRRVLGQFKAEPAVKIDGIALDVPLREARDAFERMYFEHHIQKASGNMSRVAENVGLERTHLYRKLKQLSMKIAKKGE